MGARILLGSCLWLILATTVSPAQPIRFIENKGQWPDNIDFVGNVPGGRMAIASGSIQYILLDQERIEAMHLQSHDGEWPYDNEVSGHAVFVEYSSYNRDVKPQAIGRSDSYYNFFLGNNPKTWASGVYAYDGILYPSFFEQIDLKVYTNGEHVKYDFIVAPGGDPNVIVAAYRGAERVFLSNGDLVIRTTLGDIIEKKPVAWQIIEGRKVNVSCSYKLVGNEVRFDFPQGYDDCHELVIDPLLIFSTFSGSTADNWGSSATPGEHGTLYSSGVTTETAGGIFPATPGAFQTSSAGLFDISILKYDSLGQQLLYATYLGGSANESPHSLVVNSSNELLMLGTTSSDDIATTENAFSRSFLGGDTIQNVIGYSYLKGSDLIICRFSPDGKQLLASTFMGGTGNDGINPAEGMLTRNYGDQMRGDILTDQAGNVYVSTVTASADFPVAASFGMSYNGGDTDAVVFKMNADLSSILWSTYLGGNSTDAAHTIKIDRLGNLYVAGGTSSADFPTTPGSYQRIHQGDADGWISRISADGSRILQSTLTGTAEYNQIYFLDLNASDEVYVYGQTTGDFPVTANAYSNPNSGQFIQKLTTELDALIFSTVFGAGRGLPDISPTAFMVNDCQKIYLAGWGGRVNSANDYWKSGTTGMVTTADAFQQATEGSDFYFMVLTDDATALLYATFLGGTQSSTHVDGGTSRFDKSGVVYHSVCAGCTFTNTTGKSSSDFPTTPGAWSRTNQSKNCNNAAFKLDLTSLKALIQTNSAQRDSPGLVDVCLPNPLGFENHSIGGETFYWDFGDGNAVVKADTSFTIHTFEEAGEYVVTLTAVDPGTCQVSDRTSVRVRVHTPQSVVPNNADLCSGNSHVLKASGAATYAWVSDDGTFVSNVPEPIVSPTDTTSYYITLREANGCVRKDTVTINVIPPITPEFEWNKLGHCTGRPGIVVKNLTDSLGDGDSWFFDFGDGTLSDQDQIEHSFERDAVYNVRLVTAREFCVYEKSIAVPIFEMLIPNVITPNASSHNDVFMIRYGPDEGNTPATFGYRVSLSIYNRWGDRVFYTNDYQYDWSAEGLASGTYFYEVNIEDHATCKSWVQVVK